MISLHGMRLLMLGFSIKISLGKSYRTVAIPKDTTFKDLHEVIQTVMEWSGYHLHEFEIREGDLIITDPDYDLMYDIIDENTAYLRDFADCKITYIYDFGDWWVHSLTFGKEVEMKDRRPMLLKSKGASPQEDSGGEAWDEEGWNEKDFENRINIRLSAMEIPEAGDEASVLVPSWSSLPLSYAVFLPKNIPLFLDPASGGVFSTIDNEWFPTRDTRSTEEMIPITDEDRCSIGEVVKDIVDNSECWDMALDEFIRTPRTAGSRPQYIEPTSDDPSDYYRSLPEWLVKNTICAAMYIAKDTADCMGAIMPPADLTDNSSILKDMYGYDLLPHGIRCPDCFHRLSNPAPADDREMVKRGFIKAKPLTMTCVGCERKSTIAFAPSMSGYRYEYMEKGFETEILTNLFEPLDKPYEDADGTNATLSLALLVSMHPRQAVHYARMVPLGGNQWNDGCCIAVLGACGEIDRDEIGRCLDSIHDDDLDPIAFCILCAINKGYGIYEDRFTNREFEETINTLDDYWRKRIRIVASGILRRTGHPHEAAELAKLTLTDDCTFMDMLALDEYIRSSREANERANLIGYMDLKKDRKTFKEEKVCNCIHYRVGAELLCRGSASDAEVRFRRLISSMFSGYNDDPRILARGSCAALILHHMGAEYKGKNLISYSIKWMCSALKAGETDEREFEDYLKEMLPLALSGMSEEDVRKILKKNGFGDVELPDVSGRSFDPSRVVSLDIQYLQ